MPASLWDANRQANLAGKNPAADEFARQFVVSKRGNLKALRTKNLELEWVRMWRAYEQMFVGGYYQGMSKIELPTIHVLVERLVPRLASLVIGRDDFFKVNPTRPNAIETAKLIEALLRTQVENDELRRKMPLTLREAVVLGTGITKTRHKYEVRPTRTIQRTGDEIVSAPDGGLRLVPKYEAIDVETTAYDGPCTGRVDLFNFYINPRAQDVDDSPVIEDCGLTRTDIMRLAEQGVFDGDAVMRALEPGAGLGHVPEEQMRTLPERAGAFIAPFAYAEEHKPYLYSEYWGEFPMGATTNIEAEKQPTMPCIIGVLGERYIVRMELNPDERARKPYSKCVIIEKPGEFYGMSLVKKALPLAMERNDARNQANDARTFSTIPLVLSDQTSIPDKPQSLVIRPGKHLMGPNIRLGAFPDLTGPVYRAESVMLRDLEDAFGAPALLDGSSDAGSASEAIIQQEQSTARFKGYAHTIEDVFIKRVLTLYHSLNRRLVTKDLVVRTLGPAGFEWRTLNPMDLHAPIEIVTMAASSMMPRATMVANYSTVYDRMVMQEQMTPGFFDFVPFWENLFKALGEEHPSLFMRALRHNGRIPTVAQVHIMLSQGQKVDPDPRQNFQENLPEYGAFIVEYGPRMPEQMLEDFLHHLDDAMAVAQQVLQERQMQQVAAAMAMQEAGGGGPATAGSSGGKQNRKIDQRQRDGKGTSLPRQAAKTATPNTGGR